MNVRTRLVGGLLVFIGIFLLVTLLYKSQPSKEQTTVSIPTTAQTGDKTTVSPTKTAGQPIIPLPQGQETVKTFLNLIAEKRIDEAIGMMTPFLIGDENSKQAWRVHFNAFKKLTVKSVEWAGGNTYKVIVEVEMKPEATNATVPNYGWLNGENTRWITLEKINDLWKIASLNTSS
jgi:hypothetical protein